MVFAALEPLPDLGSPFSAPSKRDRDSLESESTQSRMAPLVSCTEALVQRQRARSCSKTGASLSGPDQRLPSAW